MYCANDPIFIKKPPKIIIGTEKEVAATTAISGIEAKQAQTYAFASVKNTLLLIFL